MQYIRKCLAVLALLGGPLFMLNLSDTAHATEQGHPPDAIPTVSCEKITIDPQPGWGVAFNGTIGTHTGLHLAALPVAGTHDSEVTISGLTTATGTIPWTITPVWTIPPNPYGITSGDGPTTSGTLTCHEEPTTSTSTSTSTSTTVKATTTTQAPTTTVPCDRFARGVAPTDARPGSQPCATTTTTRLGLAITASRPTLPFTGSSSGPVAAVGVSAIAGGALAIWKGRQKTREVKVRQKLLDR